MSLEELKEILPEDLFSICLQNHKNRLQYLAKLQQQRQHNDDNSNNNGERHGASLYNTNSNSSATTLFSAAGDTVGNIIESWWHRLFQ